MTFFDIIHLGYVIVALLCLFLLGIVYFQNKKNIINKLFSLEILAIIVWIFTVLLADISKTHDQALFWSKAAIIGPAFIPYFFLLFTFVFPVGKLPSPRTIILLSIPNIFFIILSPTSFNVRDVIIKPYGADLEIGPLYYILFIYFLIYIGVASYNLIKKYKTSEKIQKIQISYILIGYSFSLLIAVFTNLILVSIGYSDYSIFGPPSAIFFVVFTTLAIVKYHLFNVRLILTQILVAVIALILLIQTLLSGPTILKVLNASVFILFCFFGYFLIKATLKEFEMRKEVEKLSNAKSEFISIASHQLRTPLTAIKGYISMISEGSYGRLTEKMKKPMENVYQSNERLVGLVNNLLNLSRLDAGKIKFEPKPGSLEEMIKSIIKELEVVIKNKGLYIRMKKPASPLPEVNIDQDHIRQVILNIIDNAAKYTKEGGITIELSKINNMEEIRVSDTGEGMDEKDLENLFQIFSRATAGIKLHTEGAGLGLHIAKRFVEMHGGKIWAESKGKNKGSSFIIQLPINFDSKLAKKYSSDKLRDDKTKKIT